MSNNNGFFGFSNQQIPAISGGNVSISGNYTIHTFLESGILHISNFGLYSPFFVDVLIIAGGGGGGKGKVGVYHGGGGGAGGYIYIKNYPLFSTYGNVIVTIGAGGATGLNGNDSKFNYIAATGGGRGYGQAGNNSIGGSGGGGWFDVSLGAFGITGQGNRGGNGTGSGAGAGGGGGANGGNAGADAGGNGGIGYLSNMSDIPTYYCGGGGGSPYSAGVFGLGGLGGGGVAYGGNGTPNTGGGGGGGNHTGNQDGGSGGSRVVVIRYQL